MIMLSPTEFVLLDADGPVCAPSHVTMPYFFALMYIILHRYVHIYSSAGVNPIGK